ncbi:MAG TPA: hypothetical protein VED40_01925 [Azospirillaceae bacterium]|nr:hypothetical protein [Azospirillaceae bacterium]
MRAGSAFLAAVALAVLAGCAGADPDRPPLRFRPLSPSGEPVGMPTPDIDAYSKAMEAWFRRADLNGDGSLDQPEFRADADRSFAAFDLDRDATITAAEMTQVRIASPYKPPERPASSRRTRPAEAAAEQVEETPEGERRGPGRTRLRPVLDPVMSADANADFRVTREELRAQSARRAGVYDANADGRVTLPEFIASTREAVSAIRQR